MTSINPFQFEGIVTDGRFCGRAKDILAIIAHAQSGNNIIISQKRRIGKSSLIKEVMKNHLPKKVLPIYVDIYSTISTKEIYTFMKEEIETILNLQNKLKNFSTLVASAFSEADVLVSIGKNPKIEIKFANNNYAELIKKLLLGLNKFANKSNYKVLFAIDEFQKIGVLEEQDKIESSIRTAMQDCKNICFLISGSNQTMINQMFSDGRPLYRQGTFYNLASVDYEDFFKWSANKFKNNEINLDREVFSYIYNISNGEAKIVQQICFELYRAFKPLSTPTMEEVCNIIHTMYKYNSEIASKYNNLGLQQQKIMKIIALEKGQKVTVSPLIIEYNLKSGNINALLNQLKLKNFILKNNNTYEIIDTELNIWLLVQKNKHCEDEEWENL